MTDNGDRIKFCPRYLIMWAVITRSETTKQSLRFFTEGRCPNPEWRQSARILLPFKGQGGDGVFSSEKSIEVILNGLGITKDHVLLWGSGEKEIDFVEERGGQFMGLS